MREQQPFVKRKFKTDPVVELLESMPRIRASHEGAYTFKDRANDFISLFSTDQGKRVLTQISSICDPVPRSEDADKPGTLAYKAGMRRVMTEIMLCMAVKEPIVAESEQEH